MRPQPGDLPPLPPASGTSVGYLIDAAATLKLSTDQLAHMKRIDASLSAQNDVIDTQIRSIERPEAEEPEDPKGPPVRRNHAPGMNTRTTKDAQKLHAARKLNDRDALSRVFKLLEPAQQESARKILVDRGVEAPGTEKPARVEHPEDGTPLEGMPAQEP